MHLPRIVTATLVLSSCILLSAQTNSAPQATVQPLSNGIAVTAGDVSETVTALREDVLRIRIWHGKNAPEDASWAVLPESRKASVAISRDDYTTGTAGFHTAALTVQINTQSLALTLRDAAGNILQQDAQPVHFDGTAFRLAKTMPQDEHYFGLGDKVGPLDRREQAFSLWNTDAYHFQESTDPIYKSIPYFFTYRAGKCLGVLLDNTFRSSFDFGKLSAGTYSFGAANGPIDYYLFYGPSPKQVVQTYAWLTGTSPLPPLWALGFQQSRYSYMSQKELLGIADHLRADHIPADALYLDIDYQQQNRPFTINTQAFPDFAGMVTKLHQQNFHLITITDLHIANLPGQNYHPYDSGISGDHFVKNPDGSVYSAKVWPGMSVFPDFTHQQSRAWWGTLYTDFKKMGIDGFWNDMNEPAVFEVPSKTMPENIVHRIDEPGFTTRTATHSEIHNVFGMQNSRATYEGLLTLDPNTRSFVLTRASYAGGQRYAATWTGDNSATWNHLRLTTPMLENLGLSGFAYSGADVGGFAGTPTTELLTKWLEIAAFQPIDRDHAEKGKVPQEPWAGGAEQEAIRRHYIETRYQLMPYIYTLAEETSRTGLPLVRPLFMEFPDAAPDHHPVDLDAVGEFLLGPSLLIAPPPFPDDQKPYDLILPSSNWYDFWTGGKATPTTLTPSLETLPVYVRAGSILPISPIVQSTSETPDGPLTLAIYVGDNCEGHLYQDDGKSFEYRNGKYLRMNFGCKLTADGLSVTVGTHEGSYPAWWTDLRLEIYGFAPSKNEITVGGNKVTPKVIHTTNGTVFSVKDDGKGTEILIQ